MPNMRKTNKRQLNLSVSLNLWYKLDKQRDILLCKRVSEVALKLLERSLRDVELSPEDYEKIDKEIKANEKRRRQKIQLG